MSTEKRLTTSESNAEPAKSAGADAQKQSSTFTPQPAPMVKLEEKSRLNDEVEKLRREHVELRDKLNNLRENDLFSLREKVSQVNMRFAGAAAVIGFLGLAGINTYWNLDKLIDNRLRERTNAALDFNDKFVRASTFAQVNDYESAIPIYQELFERKPEDELLFYTLLDSLNQAHRYEDGFLVVQRAKHDGLLTGQYTRLLSYNNAGYFVLIKAIDDPGRRDEAHELLKKAEEIGSRPTDNRNISLPIFNLAVYYAMVGNNAEAMRYGQRYRDSQYPGWKWSPPNDPWFKKLRPEIVGVLTTALAKPDGAISSDKTIVTKPAEQPKSRP